MRTINHLVHSILACGVLLMFTTFTSCSDSNQPSEPEPAPGAPVKSLAIDPEITYQTIAGFGGANQMWGTQFPSAGDMKKAFGSDESDLGLSIFRIRVASNPDEWPAIVNVTKEARKYGAKILASPWSPPPSLKSNGSDIGGYLLEENYEEFANYLNDFVAFMASNGVPVDAISIQNEPDIKVSYESCDWTSSQIKAFLTDYGHIIEGALVAAPESFNFNPSFTNDILNDEAAAAQLDIVAGHIYGGGLGPFPVAEEKGKEIWMTEYLMNQNANANWGQLSEQLIWDETLEMLGTIQEAMSHNWNAYIWWYLKRYYSFLGDGTQGTTSGEILKRGYAFSHFSKFVRPGFVRIKADFQQGTRVTAYEGEDQTVIVLLNSGATPVSNISLTIGGATPTSATMYETTISSNRTKKTIETQAGNLILSLAPKSITTIVVEN